MQELKAAEGYWFRTGHVTVLLPSGLGYVQLDDENRTRPFIVGQMLKGYTGKPYRSVGLEEQAPVFVALEGTSIKRVMPGHTAAPAAAVEEMEELLDTSDSGHPRMGAEAFSDLRETFKQFVAERNRLVQHPGEGAAVIPLRHAGSVGKTSSSPTESAAGGARAEEVLAAGTRTMEAGAGGV